MAIKRVKLTLEDENEIIRLYQSDIPSTHKLATKYKVGHKKISDILKSNNIPINKKGAQIKHNMTNKINDFKSNVEKSVVNGELYYLVCIKTGKVFKDINNRSGSITTHLKLIYPNLDFPSNSYQVKKYEIDNGEKWFIKYFTIESEEYSIRGCKLCDWKTTDIDNRSGAFLNHLKNEHNITIDSYLSSFPEDLKYHPKVIKSRERDEIMKNPNKFVKCEICGVKMKTISNTHLRKHKISAVSYKKKYGGQIMSVDLLERTSERLRGYNVDGRTVNRVSSIEIEIMTYLNNLGVKTESSNRKILGGKEIDIVLPDYKIGIEYNGNIHHTEYFGKKDRHYHLAKTTLANKKGYNLIHIFSDEWLNDKDKLLTKIKNIIGLSDSLRVGARKCKIKEISINDKNKFLDKFHIQGCDSSTVKLGAFYDNDLVGVMTFKIRNGLDYELTRFATKVNVIGLGSKIVKYFIKNYEVSSIISFADRRWTMDCFNNMYTKIGFELVDVTKPDYRYFHKTDKSENRLHKFNFRKSILLKKYPNILKSNMTESEMTKLLGYDRIWDCGLFKYEMIV